MRWQPGEHDRDDNHRNENPAAGGIFSLANSQAAAPGKGVSDRAGQCQNDYTCTRRIGKERCPIPPPPNDEREKRQHAADSKREVLDDVIHRVRTGLALTVTVKTSDIAGERASIKSPRRLRPSADREHGVGVEMLKYCEIGQFLWMKSYPFPWRRRWRD